MFRDRVPQPTNLPKTPCKPHTKLSLQNPYHAAAMQGPYQTLNKKNLTFLSEIVIITLWSLKMKLDSTYCINLS